MMPDNKIHHLLFERNKIISGIIFSVFLMFFLTSCHHSRKISASSNYPHAGYKGNHFESKVSIKNKVASVKINTGKVSPDKLMDFAETLQGVPYKFGSCDKKQGFDCSGFIWYVFNHFNIKVPRSSVEYTNAGKEVKPENSRRGDIILFTGSNAHSGAVGHMGLVTENDHNSFRFIHAASGGGKGVMISEMSDYFYERFVKIIRVFN